MTKTFDINSEAIRQLAEILQATELTEIEYEHDGCRVRVAKSVTVGAHPTHPFYAMPTGIVSSSLEQQAPAQNPAAPLELQDHSAHPGLLKSPMVGTVYLAPEPHASTFVKVGDTVTVGQTLLLIEAMKVMNPIKAQQSGRISQILVSDAQPTEFGAPLLIIES